MAIREDIILAAYREVVAGREAPRERVVAIDFETATASRSSACSLGLVVMDGGTIVEERDWLFRPPGNRYEAMNISVHGIRPGDTAASPSFAEAWPEIAPWLASGLVIAHNAAFDLYVLKHELEAARVRDPRHEYGCTLLLSRKALPHAGHRLNEMATRYGIALKHHDAASDARACAIIGARLADEAGVATVRDAFRYYGVKTRRTKP